MNTLNLINDQKGMNKGNRFSRILAVLAFILISFAMQMNAQVYVKVCPRPPAYSRPAAPHSGHIWIDGDWVYNGRNYVWREGYWAAPKHGHRWVPGHWKNGRNGYKWVPGHWRRK